MDNKNFGVIRIMLPEYENAFIFDLVDNTNIATACYLLRQKGEQVVVDKIIGLMTLLGNYKVKSKVVTNDEFNIFMILLKKWMDSEHNYMNLNIEGLDETTFMEPVRPQDFELIRSFVDQESSLENMKKH